MKNNTPDIGALQSILLVVLDGCEFPNAMNALREAGFNGSVRAITHQEWRPILEGQCGTIHPFPASDASKTYRGVRLAQLLCFARGVDAIVWVAPPGGKTGALLRRAAASKPIYSFYDGLPAPYRLKKRAGLPALDPQGIREEEIALHHLSPILARKQPTAPALRLGVDGDGIHFREATGVQWYKRHLFSALLDSELNIDLRVTCVTDKARNVWERPWAHDFRRIPKALAATPAPNRAEAPDIEEVTGPIDLFHMTFFDPPKFKYKRVVATVYDITPIVLPDAFPTRFVERLRAVEPFWRNECARLICISEATRDDLQKHLDIPKARTVCIPPGKHPHFTPRPKVQVSEALRRYGIRQPYFMALGSIAPHKNLQGLCDAFAKAKDRFDTPHQLVIVGRPGWMMKDVLNQMSRSGIARDVLFTDYADWCDLPALYSGAAAFCMPSFYEGYGLPVQEALCCGCPVLLSNCTSLPEVAGDAGIYWDPANPEDMADRLVEVANGVAPRELWEARALARAEAFPTWHEVAVAHKAVYKAVIDGDGGTT